MPTTISTIIPLQLAAEKAIVHCTKLFSPPGSNFMLEEVEYLETEGVWLITVGFDVPASARTPIQMLHLDGVQFVRHYKRVKIHNQTGEPLSVHIRKLD